MKDLLARASRARRQRSSVAGGSAGVGGGGGVMSKNPQYLFSPVLPSSEPSACLALLPGAGATTLLLAKAKTLQEKTPEYISQH